MQLKKCMCSARAATASIEESAWKKEASQASAAGESERAKASFLTADICAQD